MRGCVFTFPACWGQLFLSGGASRTVHSSLLLSGECWWASICLWGVWTRPSAEGRQRVALSVRTQSAPIVGCFLSPGWVSYGSSWCMMGHERRVALVLINFMAGSNWGWPPLWAEEKTGVTVRQRSRFIVQTLSGSVFTFPVCSEGIQNSNRWPVGGRDLWGCLTPIDTFFEF